VRVRKNALPGEGDADILEPDVTAKMLLLTLACGMLFACTSMHRSYVSDSAVATFSNESLDASLKPVFQGGRSDSCGNVKSFKLTIVNKTDKPIELIWDKTSYLRDGVSHGGFTYHGIPYKEKDLSRLSAEIPSRGTFSKSIFPSILLQYTGPHSAWELREMKAGEHGAMLAIKVGEKEIRVKLTVMLKEM